MSVTDEDEEGVWKDYHTQQAMNRNEGFYPNGGTKENCVVLKPGAIWQDINCQYRYGVGCSCTRTPLPYLQLRGLSSSSGIDTLYLHMKSGWYMLEALTKQYNMIFNKKNGSLKLPIIILQQHQYHMYILFTGKTYLDYNK